METSPLPGNELERVNRLSELDLDYTELNENLKDLAKLAAKVAGAEISLVNLIDSFTQYTVSNYGLDLDNMVREDSVCQYTIVAEESFEVKDLTADDRFKDKFYLQDSPLRYYFGVPLQTTEGYNLGALCILNSIRKEISPEKIEMLKLIANEIVNSLKSFQVIELLKNKLKEEVDVKHKVAHDIRGPLGGIISLASVISEQGDKNTLDEVLEFINLIRKSSSSLLDLADEILSVKKREVDQNTAKKDPEFSLKMFKDKLIKLYTPQSMQKQIQFSVNTTTSTEDAELPKNKLLQIAGNLVSNAMKFTPSGGQVTVNLGLELGKLGNRLQIEVQDSGIGMDKESIDFVLNGLLNSTEGTQGEKGYGFGLPLVRQIVHKMKGEMNISSEPAQGTSFRISIPVKH